jgi:hypothetical protein
MRLVSLVMLLASIPAHADPKTRIGFETDPVAIALFHGGELAATARLPALPHVRLEVALAAHERYPSFIAEAGDNAGWRYGQEFVAINAMYFLSSGRGGLFFGPGANLARQHFTPPGATMANDVTRITLCAAVGYQWFPSTKSGLYIQPWALAMINLPPISGSAGSYHEVPVAPAISLHVGYEL